MTSRNILRMQEVNLVADILIAMREGIKSKKQIKKYYDQYEESFDDDVEEIAERFDAVIATIGLIFPEGLTASEFSRNHLFYSLFSTELRSSPVPVKRAYQGTKRTLTTSVIPAQAGIQFLQTTISGEA